MLWRILEARAYWQAKIRYDARGRGTADPPIVATVKAIDLELVQDARAAREEGS